VSCSSVPVSLGEQPGETNMAKCSGGRQPTDLGCHSLSTPIVRKRSGFTLLELAIVSLLIGLTGTLMISGLLKGREKARRSQCERKLGRIIRGVLHYESTNGAFPPGRQYPDWLVSVAPPVFANGYTNYQGVSQSTNQKTGFYSVHVWILPFVRASNIFDEIDFSRAQAKQMTNGGSIFNINYNAYNNPMPLFLCPSDPNTGRGITENNYRCNFGGDTPGAGARTRHNTREITPRLTDLWHCGGNGAFTIGEQGLQAQDFEDGLSKTVFFSERIKGDGTPSTEIPTQAVMITSPFRQDDSAISYSVDELFEGCDNDFSKVPNQYNFNGAGRWFSGEDFSNGWPFAGYDSTQYNHMAPPNWEHLDCGFTSAIADTPGEHMIVAARSAHPRSVHVAFGDGHTKRVRDDIDLTVWRAIGTRNGGEIIPDPTKRKRRRWRPGGRPGW